MTVSRSYLLDKKCPVCEAHSTWRTTIPNPYLEELDQLDIHECDRCRLVFVATLVTPAQLDIVYGRGGDEYAARYYAETEDEARAKARRAATDLRPLLTGRSGPVIDIGFGFGHFFEEFAKGGPPEVFGQELGSVNRQRWAERGVRTITKLSEAEEGACSAAVMLDVAEHVIDANETFADVNRLLADDGILYIHTPRRSVWDTLALLAARAGLARISLVWLRSRVSIAHLRLWNDGSLILALERAGFEVVSLTAECELSWPIRKYVHVYLTEQIRPVRLQDLIERSVSAALTAPLRFGVLRNKAIVVARKTEAQPHGSGPSND